jgi:predicted secreted protein
VANIILNVRFPGLEYDGVNDSAFGDVPEIEREEWVEEDVVGGCEGAYDSDKDIALEFEPDEHVGWRVSGGCLGAGTTGVIDFSYEVSRELAVVFAASLMVSVMLDVMLTMM